MALPRSKPLSLDPSPARPPGALPEPTFAERCVGCLDCVAVCPARALHAGHGRLPELSHPAACIFCGLCADICTHSAIGFTVRTRTGLDAVLRAEREAGPTL